MEKQSWICILKPRNLTDYTSDPKLIIDIYFKIEQGIAWVAIYIQTQMLVRGQMLCELHCGAKGRYHGVQRQKQANLLAITDSPNCSSVMAMSETELF